jgi:hypothetical protein
MSRVRNVEKRIFDIEGFEVRIRNQDGRALPYNGDLPMYTCYERMAPNKWRVQEWKDTRFYRDYPGFKVDVFDGNGRVARGNSTLGNIRDTYN